MTFNLATAFSPDQQIQALYIAYYGRPAEPAGRAYWADRYAGLAGDDVPGGTILARFASEFANVPESGERYPFLANPATTDAAAFVGSVFQAVFDRPPEGDARDPTTGLGYWTDRITRAVRGDEPIGDSVLAILDGARGDDAAIAANKIAAAQAYTDRIGQGSGDYDSATGASILDRVTADQTRDEARALGTADADPPRVTTTIDLASDPAFVGREPAIEAAAHEAMDRLLALLDPAEGNVELEIKAVDTDSLALGGSTYVSTDLTPSGGVASVLATQLTSGRDSNGTEADATIEISRQKIDALDFGNGQGNFDAVNVFTHELFHAIGISSFIDQPDSVISATVWDTFLVDESDGYYFTGPNAMAVNGGGRVPLDGPAHLSEAVYGTALMTPIAEFEGGEEITDLDVALLRDLGLPMDDGAGGLV